MKIFLTGDNHIGLKYARHEQAAILAERRLTAFERMVQAANQENCDLFIIAGDLFENTSGISQKDLRRLLEQLSHFHGTVAVLPGNHDYYDKDARVWQQFKDALSSYDNIFLMSSPRPYPLNLNDQRVVLYPALCTAKHSEPGKNALGWIRDTEIADDDAYHIGIAHGAVQGETIDNEGEYFLMTREELEEIPVDVWLIGHTHVPFPRNLTEFFTPEGRIFNAGTHVQTDVACNTEGQCFIIELCADKSIRAKKFVSGNLRFYRREVALTAGNMEEELRRAVAGIDKNSVVDLILSGAVSAEEYESRDEVLEDILSPFLEHIYYDDKLSKRISRELIHAEFPETSFSAGLLTALLEEPKEAQLAYELLKSLKEGK